MKNKNIFSSIGILLFGIIIFSYITTKATVSSFTIDESFTYLNFVHYSFMDILAHRHPYSNNHLLNSMFMKYSELAFGSSEIALRLPNLILLLVFFIYTFLLLRKFNWILSVSIFVLMSTNTILIDLFGLARGYGISIGFMMMSLYHLIQSFYTNKNKNLVLFNISGSLAILSHFTMLDFYLAALLTFNLIIFIDCRYMSNIKFNFFKTNKVNLIMMLISALFLYEPVRRVIKFNVFDSGGRSGLFHNTVASIINISFLNIDINPLKMFFLQLLVISIVFISLSLTIINLYKGKKEFFQKNKALIITNLILLTISFEIILQHFLFKTDFVIGRFAMFLFPLLILNLGYLFNYVSGQRFRKIVLSFSLFLALFSSINFYKNSNLYSCAEWGFDMETKNALKKLIAYRNQTESKQTNIRLGVNWLFESTINFYKQVWQIDWLLPVDRNGPTINDDYFYICDSDLTKINLKKYEVLFSSERTNTILIKNNK